MSSKNLKNMMTLSVLAAIGATYYITTLKFPPYEIHTFLFEPFRVKLYIISGIGLITMLLVYFFGQSFHKKHAEELKASKKKGKKKKIISETKEDSQSWGSVISDSSKKRDII